MLCRLMSENAPLSAGRALRGNVLFHPAPALAISAASDKRTTTSGSL
jgi:hypothetical protein